MPTEIHELSNRAISLKRPVDIFSFSAWNSGTAELSEGMANCPAAQNLRRYCTDADLTPLASEWWHFNDLHTYSNIKRWSNGNYTITECLSEPPA
jgi:D-alanyl-D-alanine dipeptidase